MFPGKREKGIVRGKDDEKILEYSPRLPLSFFNAWLCFTRCFETPNSLIVLSMVVKGIGLKFEHNPYKKWIFCIFLAVLPTWHKTNIKIFVVFI